MKKVWFTLEPGGWHGSATETVWAEELAPGQLQIRNVPFYVHGVSYGDVVGAVEREGGLWFDRVLRRSGHSTYRIISKEAASAADLGLRWQSLEALGCTYEQGHGRLRAVDVPPAADIHRVYALLQEGLDLGVWDFDEGHCGHPV